MRNLEKEQAMDKKIHEEIDRSFFLELNNQLINSTISDFVHSCADNLLAKRRDFTNTHAGTEEE